MRTRLVVIGFAVLATISLAACTDERRDLLAPRSPEKLVSGLPIFLNPADFLEIAAGAEYTCARQRDGDVWCWGLETPTPTRVFQGATHIAVGDRHACALNSAGAAFCWGMDTNGQVGWDRDYHDSFTPVSPVLGPSNPSNPYGPLLPALTFTSIAAGNSSTCGTTSSGVFCWGDLGGEPSVTPSPTAIPQLITTTSGSAYAGFTSLAVGKSHACGFVSGQVNCWGLSAQFQTGVDPSLTFAFLPFQNGTLSNVVSFAWGNQLGSSVARVSAQGALTCADMLNKTVECFGNNDNGQLGSGPGASTFVPAVIGGGTLSLHGVAAGALHACALDGSGLAQCWGADSRGELGNGQTPATFTTVQKVGPVNIGIANGAFVFSANPVTFRALASGAEHTCGISTDNHIFCWGDNQSHQLGRNVYDVNSNLATFTVSPVQTM